MKTSHWLLLASGIVFSLGVEAQSVEPINERIASNQQDAANPDLKWVDQNAKTDAFRFRVSVLSGEADHYAVTAIQVLDRRGKVIQLIPNVGGQPVMATAETILGLVDANSDGHLDFFVPAADGGAGPNSTSYFYLFEPRLHKFKQNKVLSSLPQVSVNPDHSITSSYRDGCCTHGTRTYRFIANRLTLVGSRDESLSSDGQMLETTVGIRQKGKMRYTSTKRMLSSGE